ncbi:alkaline phosphatase [Methylomarinum vadi]|uniref:alkaline phosphatase n=1 Tax=Methylomarinum vadi TaxID=438855 RepID=UPI0004DF1710|nr:alkaline phosphatase [Methylomarinum vadi]
MNWLRYFGSGSLCLLFLALTACSQQEVRREPTVKNIILMIGDGMGPQQLGLLQAYAQRAQHSIYSGKGGLTAFDRFAAEGYVGLSNHWPADALVTDSACSASQLASGVASGSEMIGLDQDGNPVETILEKAKIQGKSTGLVSDTRITHATPAAFAAHQPHRSWENEIAEEMLSSGNVDVMLSGGLRYWLPATANADPAVRGALERRIGEPALALVSKRKDSLDLLSQAERRGYRLAFNQKQLQQATGNKLLGLFASAAMQDGIDYHQHRHDNEPSLAQMTLKALQTLASNPKGFFLMVEGGQIDWAGHNNDAGNLLHEMVKFEEAVAVVYEWASRRDDTLVLITADHETGGFGFSYSRYRTPEAKALPGKMFEHTQYRPNFNFGSVGILDRLYKQKKSFYQMWRQIERENSEPSARQIMQVVNDYSDFKIDLEQAKAILAQEANEYRRKGHKYLSAEYFPKVHDFKEFYVYGKDVRLDLIGRALAKEQNVVWATGTHTHTPVPVIVWGAERYARPFSSLSHHTDIARRLIGVLNESAVSDTKR